MRFPTMWYVRPAKHRVQSAHTHSVKLLTEHHLEFQSLKEGYICSSESTLVKMPHCWIMQKSQAGPMYMLKGDRL